MNSLFMIFKIFHETCPVSVTMCGQSHQPNHECRNPLFIMLIMYNIKVLRLRIVIKVYFVLQGDMLLDFQELKVK